jgi:alginate O-acetyltransferase complex protein AlgI
MALSRWVPQAEALAGRPRIGQMATVAIAAAIVTLLGFCVSRLGSYSPFLYYQF